MSLLPVEEALRRVLESVTPLGSETVDLIAAGGRVLSDDVIAHLTQPPFNASAMDGYAVRGDDVKSAPAHLTVIGEANAGGPFNGVVGPGEAVRIFTGGSLPEGADTVIIQENTERDGEALTVLEPASLAANVRRMGSDFRAGETLLKAGRRLNASAITLAAAGGHAQLAVRRKPRIAILATGDELVAPGNKPGIGQIISSNPYGLAALIESFGGEACLLGIAADNMPALTAALAGADDADVLVTIGGASVGDRDLVKPALEARGMALDFWKVAIRPGKPMLFGRLNTHQRVLGLPGNPLSCLITARIFLVPLLYAFLGRTDDPLAEQTAVLAGAIPENGPRQHYMRALLTPLPGELPRAAPLSSFDSAHITALATANALIVRAPCAKPAAAGEIVRVLPIDF
ncbi:gephyrin-like molybdotransferase Glp [Hyphomicrobium sp. D-2]|uniref:molybdopterin molybdotransferase MoeA n=1 Tax=Hyphomicrobium sp. D-2 TaxID=3041621 RepID=UPI0024552610|nr:gephyrin-like molybdotransferase Glp [Hyphomicrobium sp. D-2]MDH4981410.1 molybdopterin molybdotransferase MoeA [Hyphomicrobium sp. D-2]